MDINAACYSSYSNPKARKADHTCCTRRFVPLHVSMICFKQMPILDSSKLLKFAEFTTMAGRRLREAVKETLINFGSGEFDNDTHVVIAGLSNTYSQYIATFEEYMQQRYEVTRRLISKLISYISYLNLQYFI